jgi:hypothetical protein
MKIPWRGVAVVVVLGCCAFSAFGVAACVAMDQPGSALHDNTLLSLPILWQELSKVSFGMVVTWFAQVGSLWPGILLFVDLGLAAMAFTLAVRPGLCSGSWQKAVVPSLGITLGLLSVAGLFSLLHLVFTFLNAFAWRGLDGEWISELGPVYDAIGICYGIACLLFWRSQSTIRTPGQTPALTREAL